MVIHPHGDGTSGQWPAGSPSRIIAVTPRRTAAPPRRCWPPGPDGSSPPRSSRRARRPNLSRSSANRPDSPGAARQELRRAACACGVPGGERGDLSRRPMHFPSAVLRAAQVTEAIRGTTLGRDLRAGPPVAEGSPACAAAGRVDAVDLQPKWARTGSNRRPPGCKPGALPLSYAPWCPIEPARRSTGCHPGRSAVAHRADPWPIQDPGSAAMTLRHWSWSRGCPGWFASANVTTPSRSMRNVPRNGIPAAALNTPYRCRDLAVRPEVAQQRECESFRCRPGTQGIGRIAGDGQDLHGVVLEVLEVIAHLAELAGADAGEGERIEHQEHRMPAAKVGQRHGIPVQVRKREVGRGLSDDDRPGRGAGSVISASAREPESARAW